MGVTVGQICFSESTVEFRSRFAFRDRETDGRRSGLGELPTRQERPACRLRLHLLANIHDEELNTFYVGLSDQ